ncbi:MAG: gamma-glutamyl-gamma-aminobutyrate hydrolase family protein [Kiloniellales bacterium]|nr:gamma-glutamyl-gamma-aminobutyrate hydrolase family protein [Kiloniellales bacterium]
MTHDITQPSRRPVIGLTLDLETPSTPPPRGGPVQPFYALRENYCTAVARAGGLPLLLPHEPDQAEAYAAGLHGLVVTGGDFDVDPALFGDTLRHPRVTTKERRTAFELALARAALARDLPVLGICGGQQLLHVVLGGRLIQHIPDEVPGALDHEQPNPRTEPGHAVTIEPGSLLHRICGSRDLQVNSAHHQAARDTANGIAGLVVNARAPDGVIEGIEAPAYRFCLGVQWHPEYGVSTGDGAIFEAFVAAAADFAGAAP